jgi:hypothetical protein
MYGRANRHRWGEGVAGSQFACVPAVGTLCNASRDMACYTSHVKRHTSHVTRHTSHVTRHTSHVTRHTSHVTRHIPNSLLHTTRRIDCPLQAKSPAHQSNVTRHTSHVTRHTSHVTRHTSHVNAPLMPRAERCCNCAGSTRAPSTQKAAGSYLQKHTLFGTPTTKRRA